jgi:hypothetical protein
MTADAATTRRASRLRVARTRGAASGVLLLILGAWAALVPMIGPYFDLAYTPQPNTAWHWTAARGWLEVLPGAVVFVGAVLLIVSASRVVTSLGAWLAAAGGAWLLVGPSLAGPLSLHVGTPDPTSSGNVRALEALLFFYAIGAAIVFLAGIALGRLTVQSMRDVRAAERRLAAESTPAPAPAYAGAPGTAPGYAPPTGRHSTAAEPTTTQQPAQTDGRPGADEPGTQPAQPTGQPTQQPGTQPTAQRPTYAGAPPERGTS